MLSKSQIQLVRSLEQRKFRCRHHLYVVEGDKMVRETLASSLTVACLMAKEKWLGLLPHPLGAKAKETIAVNDRELSQISALKTSNQAVALVQIPEYTLDVREVSAGLSLYLDQIQDPGNLGAIIRIADWFGIRHVLCSEGCADAYNPKTVQATMGAIIRVKTHPADVSVLAQLKTAGVPVFGAFLQGENIYRAALAEKAVIVMGNESKGVSREVAQCTDHRLLIPSYPAGTPSSESLNVATATAIVCSEFRRRMTLGG
jgi:TrmH family RNA methyltransferase